MSNILNKNKVYFTSDLHFGHTNIIKYCDRPFEDSEEMTKVLISNWNAKVSPDDHIFILGDFFFSIAKSSIKHILNRLNGIKHLIGGNHDRHLEKDWFKEHFETVRYLDTITIGDDEINGGTQRIVLCHYPMLTWNGSHRGTWQLFGHIHSSEKNPMREGMKSSQYDVGVDRNNFTPLSYEEIKIIITKQFLNK